MRKSVGVVTIHYRDPSAIHELLASISRWSVRPDQLVIVDNSGDLRGPFDGDEIPHVVPAPDNPGYGAAVNLGMEALASASSPDWVLVLTQDARLDPDALEHLLAATDLAPNAEVLAPVLRFRSDPRTLFSRGGTLSRRGVALHPGQGTDHALWQPSGMPRPVDWADGAALLLRAETIRRIGGFPEEYFLYVEEVDLAHAVRRAGKQVVVVDSAVGYQEPGNYRPFLHFRNSTYFTLKYPEEFRVWPWWRFLAQGLRRSARRHQVYPVHQALLGLIDGRRRRMGKPVGTARVGGRNKT